jgi:hypothetical protein
MLKDHYILERFKDSSVDTKWEVFQQPAKGPWLQLKRGFGEV